MFQPAFVWLETKTPKTAILDFRTEAKFGAWLERWSAIGGQGCDNDHPSRNTSYLISHFAALSSITHSKQHRMSGYH